METRIKSVSEPRLSQSRQSLFSHDESEDLSSDHEDAPFITFNVPPRDPESFTRKEKIKEFFQPRHDDDGEYADTAGYTVFEEGEIPTGYGMRLNDWSDSLNQSEIDGMDDSEYQDNDDCYVYLSQTSKLYFITDHRIEEVKLTDVEKFQKSLHEFMQDEGNSYTTKRMSNDDVYEHITKYTLHMPKNMIDQFPVDNRGFSFGSLLILKKNSRPIKMHRIAEYDEVNDSISFYADSDDEEVLRPMKP